MRSFFRHCKDADLISDWICVDDNSTASDRKAMAEAFPQFRFLLKGPEDAGHARSLNLILDEIKTPLLVHLEDDWEFSQDFRLSELIEVLENEGGHQIMMVPRPYTEPISHQSFSLGRYRYQVEHPHRDQVAREYDKVHPPRPSSYEEGWWWPGFSLNPNVMDVAFFRHNLRKFDETLPPEVMEYDAAARAQKAGAVILCADLKIHHIGEVSAYSLNAQRRSWDPQSRTPELVKFVFQGGGRLGLVAYLSVLSVKARVQPNAIYFYLDQEPADTYWWRLIRDLVRVKKLTEQQKPGIHLELDVFVLRNFEALPQQTQTSSDESKTSQSIDLELLFQEMEPEQLERFVSERLGNCHAIRLWQDGGEAKRLDFQDLDIALERMTPFATLVKELLTEAAPEVLQPPLRRTAQQEAEILSAQSGALARQSMGHPWRTVRPLYESCIQDAPDRALPYYQIASVERKAGKNEVAYDFARRGRDLPRPKTHAPLPLPELYTWILEDEMAISAFWTGRKLESFERCNRLLWGAEIPDSEWDRIVKNRDFSVEEVKKEREKYPKALVEIIQWWSQHPASTADVTLTITACKRPNLLVTTINSFLNCCTDIHRIARWVCVDDGSSAEDLEEFRRLYPFFELIVKKPVDKGHAKSMNLIRGELKTPYWLHLEDDWHFLSRQPYISRAKEILEEFDGIPQVLFNRNYAETLGCREHLGGILKRTSGGHRFRLHQHFPRDSVEQVQFQSSLPPNGRHHTYWPHFSFRPSLMRTEDLLSVGPFQPEAKFFEMEFAERYTAAGFQSAFFETVNALHIGKLTWESGENAYTLNEESQFG